jgi:hypothetical protein
MIFRKSPINEMNSVEIIKRVNKCKSNELEPLLNEIQGVIEKSDVINDDILMAKTMITSRLASLRSK